MKMAHIEVHVPHCESCGRPDSEYVYFTFREHEVEILEMLKPGLMHVDGMRTIMAAVTFDEWVTQLVNDPLRYAKSSEDRRGNWSEYGRVIDMLRQLVTHCRQVKGTVNIESGEGS